jgi:hypothetical protein
MYACIEHLVFLLNTNPISLSINHIFPFLCSILTYLDKKKLRNILVYTNLLSRKLRTYEF